MVLCVVCVCVCVCVRACVLVCVRERERERETVFGTGRQDIQMLSYPLFLMAARRRCKRARNLSSYFIKGRNSDANIWRATLGPYSDTSLIFRLVGLN